jgi:hypothetical protein
LQPNEQQVGPGSGAKQKYRLATVTLIHGTWAKDAAWTQEDSSLAKRLSEMAGCTVRLTRFQWSGRNTFRARFRAAEELKVHIQKLERDNPSAPHFLIAHSHGGNVSLQAMTDPDIASLVSGVVCLSTPFLFVRPRSFSRLSAKHGTFMAIVALLLFFLDYRFESVMSNASRILMAGIALMFAVIGCLILYGRKLEQLSSRLADAVNPSTPEIGKMLVVRSIGDEALGALSGMQFAGWVVWRLLKFSESVCLTISRPLHALRDDSHVSYRVLGILGGIGLFAVFISVVGLTIESSFLAFAFPFFIALCAAGWGVLTLRKAIAEMFEIMTQLALVTLAPILAFVAIPFGPEAAVFSILTEIIPEMSPIGRHEVIQLDLAHTTKGLRHSEAYLNKTAIEATIQWIEQKILECQLRADH